MINVESNEYSDSDVLARCGHRSKYFHGYDRRSRLLDRRVRRINTAGIAMCFFRCNT